ncbi:FecR family protein [Mucilaginibacter terrenus]|uniref:FecR family protein n=1 Tax=Mucilaginibacter terrenus TaxID=2482727 RepID=A0A3E2NVM8_9SPHI|nr:FecR family protein [Mucilaginibacter terrenus]RFZ85076.1 FecR family protein [Mucilaginibacter terrenus]
MRKFTLLRKKVQAKDRALQEKLVNRYFDNMQLNNEPAADKEAGFDASAVYSRVLNGIDAIPAKRNITQGKWIAAASIVAVIAFSVFYVKHRLQILDVVSPIPQKQLVTVNGQVANFTLADGTKVWLNGGSKLSYPETFRGDKREITLSGEAFLEVAHDAKKPFIVHTGNIKTQVLGTSFNVKAYPENNFVKVDVATGKVGVVAPNIKTVLLTPAEEVLINKKDNSAVTSRRIDVVALSGWKDGEFMVKNMPLTEVLNAIYHRYNVKITADDNLTKCSISADFTNVSLQNILKIISKLVKGKAIAHGETYRLKGKGC